MRWVRRIQVVRIYRHIQPRYGAPTFHTARQCLKEEDIGVLKEQLEQLKEDAYLSNTHSKEMDLPDSLRGLQGEDPDKYKELREKLERVAKEFPRENQQTMSVANLPSYTDRTSKKLAASKPWTGEESPEEIAKRLAKDKNEKPNKIIKVKLSRPLGKQERLHKAKENVLDYRLAKHSKEDAPKKDDGWREMYQERLLGPTCLVSDTLVGVDNGIKALADQKIMEAQRRGDFDNIKRGKPLDDSFTSQNAYIDRTEYHLNRIMKRQDAIPPWIEKQGSVDVELQQFRHDLDYMWTLRAVRLVEEKNPGLTQDDLYEHLARATKVYESNEWEKEQAHFLGQKVRRLNDSLRGYNLQAPLASQRVYINLDDEIQSCYKRVTPSLAESYKKYRMEPDEPEPSNSPALSSIFDNSGGAKLAGSMHISEIKTESLGQMFWNMMKRNKSRNDKPPDAKGSQ